MSQYGHRDIVQLLLEHGADVNAQQHNLWTPLHLASGQRASQTVALPSRWSRTTERSEIDIPHFCDVAFRRFSRGNLGLAAHLIDKRATSTFPASDARCNAVQRSSSWEFTSTLCSRSFCTISRHPYRDVNIDGVQPSLAPSPQHCLGSDNCNHIVMSLAFFFRGWRPAALE